MIGLATTSRWLDLVENGLRGPTGAHIAKARIRASRVPHDVKANLAHNPLGDDGLEVLVQYLVSSEGRGRVRELCLAGSALAERALGSLATLLEDNDHLLSLDVSQVSLKSYSSIL